MQIGFIGLGIMGKPMALNLLKAGFDLHIYARRDESKKSLIDAGATSYTSPKEVAKQSDIIFTIVSDTPDVEEVILGTQGIVQGAKANTIVVDMSTISPQVTKEIAAQLASHNIEMLDAPVSGGETGAIDATLSIMVGGKAAVLEKVLPVLQHLGKNIVHVGDHGAGQVAKSCNQIVVAVTIQAVAEAMLLAQKSNVDAYKVRECLLGGFANSKILEVHGKRMLDNDFKPGFKLGLHQKDMQIVLDSAKALGLALPASALVMQFMNAMNISHADEDSSVIYKLLKNMGE